MRVLLYSHMKEFFKKWFPGKNANVQEKDQDKEVLVATSPAPENLPIGVEDFHLRKAEIEDLKKKRKEVINRHRSAVKDLESYNIDKQSKDGKRSKTYKEYLEPIEKELEEISHNLTDLRESFDMSQSRQEILEERLVRLEELRNIANEKFAQTELGKKYFEHKDKIKEIDAQITKLSLEGRYDPDADIERKSLNNQRIELEKDLQRKIYPKKEYMNYIRTIEKIDRLRGDTSINLHDAQDDQYDENGQMRVR